MFQALKQWCKPTQLASRCSLSFEDLHWLDASTLEFLSQLLADGSQDRMLTLLTFRPEFRTPWPALAHQTSLALNRLTKRQVADLMRQQTGVDVQEVVIDEVFDRSGGVPLFVESLRKWPGSLVSLTHAVDGATPIKKPYGKSDPHYAARLIMARLDRMARVTEILLNWLQLWTRIYLRAAGKCVWLRR